MGLKKRILNVLFWSVLSAAFIGPGTVTTAASAGADFGYSLIWALIFSTFACVVLQESSARLTIISGHNLGEAIRLYFKKNKLGKFIVFIVPFSIIFGCAAYETGNILGGVSGLVLISVDNVIWGTMLMGAVAGAFLWFSSIDFIAKVMGAIVALMGICFLTTAMTLRLDWGSLFAGGFVPNFPKESELLVLGLIGTTVVPYNLFLGSGLSHKQTLREMRISITIAIVLGGIISIAVLIVGTSIAGSFTFEALSAELEKQLGGWAGNFLGIGLLAAGFSSALTAPLAGAITAKSVWGKTENGSEVDPNWDSNGTYYKTVWAVILSFGILFGVLQVRPIPAIILAQALNGLILPLVAIFLFLMTNNVDLVGKNINSTGYNLIMGIVVFFALLIGLTNFLKALGSIFYNGLFGKRLTFFLSLTFTLILSWPIIYKVNLLRKKNNKYF